LQLLENAAKPNSQTEKKVLDKRYFLCGKPSFPNSGNFKLEKKPVFDFGSRQKSIGFSGFKHSNKSINAFIRCKLSFSDVKWARSW
jgi:hypothetical protein